MSRKYVIGVFYFLCIATTINVVAYVIQSDFIRTFPGADFLTIVLALLAINIATSSYIISKLEEITKGDSFKFSKTYKAIKNAIREQVVLVVVSFCVLLFRSSHYLQNCFKKDKICDYLRTGVDILLTTVFIMVISILWDTGKSIFLLVKSDSDKGK